MNLGNFHLAMEILTSFWRRAYTFLSSTLDQNPKVLKELWLLMPCPAISHFKERNSGYGRSCTNHPRFYKEFMVLPHQSSLFVLFSAHPFLLQDQFLF